MKLFRLCGFLKYLYPDAIFRIDTKEKVLYLTFDDGPNTGSTEQLIGILEKYGINGVFFCSGKAAERYPDLIRRISVCGHLIGNHGYDHLNGWVTSRKIYSENIKKASEFIKSKLFRPPYGRIKLCQYKMISKEYSVFFWDLMSYDFDLKSDKEKDLIILNKMIRPGSVIVFHDTPMALSTQLLDKFIRQAISEGYSFKLPVLKS